MSHGNGVSVIDNEVSTFAASELLKLNDIKPGFVKKSTINEQGDYVARAGLFPMV